jgi:hypothetical protein
VEWKTLEVNADNNALTSIRHAAFNGCFSLTGPLVMPASLETIDVRTFSGTNVTRLTFADNSALW